MDANTSAVFLSMVVYALYVLIPLIPSILIYKMFPQTRVTAEGEINNWKIKAGGAFAAYIVVVLLGGSLLQRTQHIIDGMSKCVWTIYIPQILLQDKNGHPLPDRQLLKALDVKLNPDVVVKNSQVVNVEIPSAGVSLPTTTLSFAIPNFGEETIDLQKPSHKFEKEGRHIKLTEALVIRQWPNPPAVLYQSQAPLAPSQDQVAQTTAIAVPAPP